MSYVFLRGWGDGAVSPLAQRLILVMVTGVLRRAMNSAASANLVECRCCLALLAALTAAADFLLEVWKFLELFG